jgi:DNA-binding CsgD family transcriptional regulator
VGAPMLEREHELQALDAALAGARAGDGGLVFVEAHAGIGKSALLAGASRMAEESGMLVLLGRGSELEREHSFGVAMQLLEPPLARASPSEREDLLSGAASLARPLLEGEAMPAAAPEEQLFSMLHGLYWLVSNLAERSPLLLAADDAHWTDLPSLRCFLYLAQRIADLPVALVVTGRPAEPGAPEELLRGFRTHDGARVLRPGPLSPSAASVLVGHRLPAAAPEFATACAEVTEGNPYLLTELLAEAEQRGLEPTAAGADEVRRLAPDSVLQAAVARLARLPEGATAVARAVAVLGDEATPHNVAALSGLDHEPAAQAVDALVAGQLMKHERPLAFVHPLLHSAFYREIPPGERARLHSHAARLLAAAGAAGETVASHLLASPGAGDGWAVEQLRAAAARSLGTGAVDSAITYLSRALEEPPDPSVRPELLVELGRAESLGGRPEAIERLDGALARIGDPVRRAQVLRELGWTIQKTGDMRLAVETFERGLAEVDPLADRDEAARAEAALLRSAHSGAALLEPKSAQQAQRILAGLRNPRAAVREPHERELLPMLATQLLFDGEAQDEVIALALEVWDEGALLEREGSNTFTVWHVIGCLSWADALDEAEVILEATVERARREGSVVTLALGHYARAWPRFWRGDLAGCAADAEAAMSAWSGDFSMYLPVAAHWYAVAQLELGNVVAASRALDFPNAEQRWGRSNMYAAVLGGQGLVAMAEGRVADAVTLFQGTGDSVLTSVVTNPAVFPWRSWLSLALLAEGDRAGARAAAREEVDLARRFGAGRPLGIALRTSGLAEGGEEGLALLDESVAELRASPSHFELARSLVEQGAAMRRAGRAAEARAPLREGLALADRFGAVVLADRARDELLASGARPRRREQTGAASLTPSELRVSKLAASGLTNREIAQSLFVTVKAVQWHLRNAYRKLEIGGRDDLPAALRGET